MFTASLISVTIYANQNSGLREAPSLRETPGPREAPGLREAPGPRVAILIEATPPLTGDPASGVSFALGIALGNYVDYHLSGGGIDFQLFQLDSSGLESSFYNALQDSGFTDIVTIRPSGKFRTVQIPMLNERRRQYFLSVPDQLNLCLDYHVQTLDKGSWSQSRTGIVKAKPRRPWLVQPTGTRSRAVDSLIAVTPEPVEFVIMRSVQKLFDKLKLSRKYAFWATLSEQADENDSQSITTTEAVDRIDDELLSITIPTTIVYDALSSSEDANWEVSSGELIAYVNRLLKRQFGAKLSPVTFETEWLGHGGVEPLTKVFQRFQLLYANHTDSLVIGLYGERRGIDFFQMREFDAVGFGDAGRGRAIVKLFPSTRKEIEKWRPFLTGRSLIHEIGHIFGAIHCSDLNSIMNHSATWLSPGRFDPINREIIKAVLKGELTVTDPVSYARFLSSAILRTHYRLADFPPVFFRFLEDLDTNPKRMRQAIGGKLFVLAAEGFGALQEGKLGEAAGQFREAIKLAPNQASLHYYLALCTGGTESANAMKRAAGLGYNLARERLRVRTTRKQTSR